MTLTYGSMLLKLSGEALGEGGRGIVTSAVQPMVKMIGEAHEAGIKLGVVVGAGNLWRGAGPEAHGFDLTRSHQIGLLGTIMNAVALSEILIKSGVPSRAYSAIALREIIPSVDIHEARRAMDAGEVVLFGGGTGNPYFTTDSAAALRAVEMGVGVLAKGTKVDGVYDRDPMKDPNAKKFDRISYEDILRLNLKVMDASAFAVCRDNRLPVVVFNMAEPSALVRIAKGEKMGTLVS
jgi:uridylate kinase